jgi:hypothetical protein
VDALSLGLTCRSGESLSPVGGTINGKLLTNQTTVIVGITILTHWSGRQNIPTPISVSSLLLGPSHLIHEPKI